jgi:hypothetical protein
LENLKLRAKMQTIHSLVDLKMAITTIYTVFMLCCWWDVVELTLIAKSTARWTLQGGPTVELAMWNNIDDRREARDASVDIGGTKSTKESANRKRQ